MTNETNIKRLEAIKRFHNFAMGEDWDKTILPDDITWLIEQAEEAQKLCKLYNEQGSALTNRSFENKKLREALESIAEETGTPYADIAIKALEGLK